MAKIVCPHCQAVNQDVSLNEPCWKCGTVLGAPASAIDTTAGPPNSAANPSEAAAPPKPSKVQQALAENQAAPQGPVYAEPPNPSPNRGALYIGIGVFVIALIILLIIFLINRH